MRTEVAGQEIGASLIRLLQDATTFVGLDDELTAEKGPSIFDQLRFLDYVLGVCGYHGRYCIRFLFFHLWERILLSEVHSLPFTKHGKAEVVLAPLHLLYEPLEDVEGHLRPLPIQMPQHNL